MQISTKFTIAIHMLVAIDYFGDQETVNSASLADSIGSNPVIIRNLMSELKHAGLIDTKRGPGGIKLLKPLDQITFYDVYLAVEKNKDELFNFHEHVNLNCPVGRNIHQALSDKLLKIQRNFEDDLKRQTVGDVEKDVVKAIDAK
ncbi:Rrf2 family transcriptional regulator [Limosilactobacillus mucosae]|mgnify:CR=1 FL=1|uniref:Rrf2 family transcriptional regulator n=1 Tax=Limosilactobacillus mucosae TaxID=97478 RepID=A0AAJ1MA73_LIMMU|nr:MULTISPECIES: Rrf2 family transcriptional regulator [Lactobacillaceae]MDD6864669.1 Rrf2 family transcriptional regulator [Lactobacillus sp.]MDC2829375.1 Rrf2 family transcriptional regulator [Limosilactobacillus mucosae]MDC2837058.1 Rrf2 family transcriptional regulator [Limosilactobacillus mucosae]MDC2838967.1 Rrf2 family transcriptional regulator [Limosilactobacillus mucosae]MDC2844817.1 Rrf2 family transcriptional regulator [Limosilactobacillus mucosae]